KSIAATLMNVDIKAVQEINIVSEMLKNPDAFSEIVAQHSIEIPDMSMFGIVNLADTPSWATLLTPIIIIPLLVLVTGYAQQFVIQKLSYQPNPEAAKQMRGMTLFMPLMTVWFSFMLPAALGLYWSFQNVLGIAQQAILWKVYPIPVVSEEEMKAAEREYKAAQKHNVKVASKRRSIVYDDDDDIPEIPVPKKQAQPEQTKEAPAKTNGIIAPAPLKENNDNKEDK
ncbi:MAG: YidC/Oxa1 family membrane protein insertase, partial [Clostridia bacterium]|nr:YidC/Oxa1 family membrane protein insertase [Clostridia bacterium]